MTDSPQQRWCFTTFNYFHPQQCPYCGRFSGMCAATNCLFCGRRQCMSHGTRDGTCGLCLCGLLVGWLGNDVECSYKRCHRPAVARGRGRKRICTKHAEHQGLATTIKLSTWWQLLEEA